jgi:hypothetical protein
MQTRYVILFSWMWVNCPSSVDKIKWHNSGWVHLQKCIKLCHSPMILYVEWTECDVSYTHSRLNAHHNNMWGTQPWTSCNSVQTMQPLQVFLSFQWRHSDKNWERNVSFPPHIFTNFHGSWFRKLPALELPTGFQRCACPIPIAEMHDHICH